MKTSLGIKAILLCILFVVTSCATTKYTEKLDANVYSNLRAGKSYVFTTAGNKKTKLVFLNMKNDSIIGTRNGTNISLAKKDVIASKDKQKANLSIAGIIIGAAAIGALVVGSTRATSN